MENFFTLDFCSARIETEPLYRGKKKEKKTANDTKRRLENP